MRSGAGLVIGTNGANTSFTGSTVTAGAGGGTGGAGAAAGSDLFLQTNTTTTLAPGTGTTLTLNGTIADDSPSSVPAGQTYKAGTGAGAALTVGTGLTTGTVVLTGANTYSGGTTFASGILNAGSAGALGTVGTLSFAGGTLQYSAANQTDYSGRFSQGANQAYSIDTNGQAVTFATALTSVGGSLTKLGIGTLTTTADNTYTGGTTVTGGLQLGNGGATGSVIGNVALVADPNNVGGNGNLIFNRNNTYTFGGVISGTGSVTQQGTGTTILTGANTFAGTASAQGGILQANNAAALGTGNILVTIGQLRTTFTGTLTNNQLGFAGTVGSVTAAAGTTATYTGIFIQNPNTMANFGSATDTGTVVLADTGAKAAGSTIAVNGGTLEVDGTVASPNVVVNNGATLSGTGTIGDPTIAAGGTLAPGNAANPYGTLTLGGPLTFQAGSFYNVAITPTQNSFTQVNSTTAIAGGTVQVAAGAGTYAANTRYTILTATGGVAGQFAGVTTNLAFLMPRLSYDANDVFLTVLPSATFASAAATQNQFAVATGLTNASNANGNTGPILAALNQLTVQQARAAFDSLSGEGITAAQNSAHRQVSEFTSSIFDQTTFYGGTGTPNSITLTAPRPGAGFFALAPSGAGTSQPAPLRELADLPSTRAAPPPPAFAPVRTWRAWATGFGGAEDIHGQAGIGSATQNDTIFGGTLGVDYQLLPNYLAGIAIGGSDGEFNVAGRATSGSTTGGHIAFYDLAEFGPFYGASSNSFSQFTNHTTRNVAGFGGLAGETDRGDFDSHEFRTRLEFGRHVAAYSGVITPFVALEIAELRSNGFNETNLAGPTVLGLNVQGQSSADVPGFVGLRYQGVAPLGNGMVLSPSLQVAYIHEFAPERTQIGGLIDLPGSTFLVDGARPSSNAAQVKAGAELAIGPRSVIFATFDGEFSGQAQFYGGKGGFKYLF